MRPLEQDETTWKIRPLLITHGLALLLMLSWVFEPTRSLWQSIDDVSFWFFNNSLKDGSDGYRYFWAMTNMRAFDMMVAIPLLGIFVVHALINKKALRGRHFGILVALIFTLGIWTGYGTFTGIGQLLPVERLSATLEYTDSFRLKHWSTELKTKDSSSDSFPGDHGMILMIAAGFVVYYFSRSYAWFAIILAIIGTMPRVVAGAHWVTDEVVGAVFIAMLALSWNFHTPAGEFIVRNSDRLFQKTLALLRLN